MATNSNKRVVAFQLKVETLGDDIKSIKDIDKQVKELVKARKELNVTTEQGRKEYEGITTQIAKLKGVQAQERQELRLQTKSFQLLGDNVDIAKGSIRDLQQQQKELREQLSRNTRGVTIAADEYDNLEAKFKENAVTIADFNRNLSASNQLVGEYDRGILNALKNFGGFDQLKNSLEGLNKKQSDLLNKGKDLRKEYARLEKTGGQAFEDVKRDLVQVDKELKEVEGSIKGVESALEKNNSKFDTLFDGVKGIGALIVAQFAFDKIVDFGAALVEVDKQMSVLSSNIQNSFEVTGDAAANTAIKIKAISDSFEGIENQDLFESARSGAKAFNESIDESTESLEALVLNASNAPEALSQFEEYSPVLNEIFQSSEQVAASILQFERMGIPLDKGADALKEFNLRITEQTKATRTALENAFGGAFTNELLSKVKKGEITIQDALKTVSTELGKTTVDATEAQAVITDVFGGAGEDAGGREFVEALAEANFNLEELTETSTVYIQQKKDEIRLNEALSREIIGLNAELGIQGTSFKNLGLSIKVFAIRQLRDFIKILDSDIIQPGRKVASFFTNFRVIVGKTFEGISADVKGFATRFASAFSFSNLKKAVLGDFSGFEKIFNDVGANTVANFKEGIEDGLKEIGDFSLIDAVLGDGQDAQVKGGGIIESALYGDKTPDEILQSTSDFFTKTKEQIEETLVKLRESETVVPLSGYIEGVENAIGAIEEVAFKLRDLEGIGIQSADLVREKYKALGASAIDVAEKTGLASNAFDTLSTFAKEGTAAYEGFTKAAELLAAAQQVAAQVSFIAGIAQSVAGGPLGFINGLKIAASVASILATVKGAFASFEDGGSLSFIDNPQMSKGNRGIVGGKRHRSGGNKGFYQGNGFETEQGEGFAYVGGTPFVLSRKAMSLPDVRQLVEAADYNFPTFEQGGSFNVLAAQQSGKSQNIVVQNQGITAADVAFLIDKKVSTIQVVNVATETTAVSNKVKQVQNEFGV